LGPAACTIGRINNRYRYRIIIKCRVSSVFRELMSGCLTEFMKNRQFGDVRISADVNGDIGL
jgi:primosomal protein N' (replication factor Y)